MPISDPVETNDRGFLTYAGGPIATDYGHTITVRESSAAEGPHVWLFVTDSMKSNKINPHLSLAQAIALRAALDQFIDGVPERWDGGDELLAEARRQALGESD
jgi:hypothetical protein